MIALGRTIGIGIQDFEDIIKRDCFYIDKTSFIKEWWENEDSVTPTINLSICPPQNSYTSQIPVYLRVVVVVFSC